MSDQCFAVEAEKNNVRCFAKEECALLRDWEEQCKVLCNGGWKERGMILCNDHHEE